MSDLGDIIAAKRAELEAAGLGMPGAQAQQASTVDWCERWPEEGHSWTWTKHAGLPTVATRTCSGCHYLDVSEVQQALAASDLTLTETEASYQAEIGRLRLEVERAEARRSAALILASQVDYALRVLVGLHDGPRDADYERDKPWAWQLGRDAVNAVDAFRGTPKPDHRSTCPRCQQLEYTDTDVKDG